jgi:DNA-binding NarL/FixJ family response regulator
MSLRLLLVDDHALFRDGLRRVIEAEPDMTVAGQAACVEEAVRLAGELQPEIILMDVNLHGGSGIEATRAILAQQPGVKIIALTMYEDAAVIAATLQAGAQGYVLKDTHAEELVQAIRTVGAGGVALNPAVASMLVMDYRRLAGQHAVKATPPLSGRELEVLQLAATGATNAGIAEKLFLSKQTVKNLLTTVYQKLGVNNRTEAVARAIHEGLIRRGE